MMVVKGGDNVSNVKGVMQFGYDPESKKPYFISAEHQLHLNDVETEFLQKIYSFLSPELLQNVRVVRNSDDYVSVVFGEYNDFLRFKFTDRAKWISLRLSPEDRKLNKDNPLFDSQKNKNQLHWKSNIHSISDLDSFRDLVSRSCRE